MAAKRVWFPNIPSSGIGQLDRSQAAIGIPFSTLSPNDTNYFRRYLNDTESVILVGTPVVDDVVSETGYTTYLRRYLDDVIL